MKDSWTLKSVSGCPNSEISEILLFSVLFDWGFSWFKIATFVLVRMESVVWELWSRVGVASGIVSKHFFLSQISDISHWISTPNLSSRNQSTWRNNWVGKNLSTSFDSSSTHNDRVVTNHNIIIDDAWIDWAVWFNSDIFANIDWCCKTVRQGLGSVDHSAIANAWEMSDSNWVVFSTNCDVVPDCWIFADQNFTN